jgi:hypothetical protein
MENGTPSWASGFKPARASVPVCFDFDIVEAFTDAEKELDNLETRTLGDAADKRELQEKVAALREQYEAKATLFVFESIGRTAWRELVAKHPPTKEQLRDPAYPWDVNADTFPQASIAASCSSPGCTPEEAQWLADHLAVGEFDRLWAAALKANVEGAELPKETSTVALRAGGRKLTPQSV